MEVGTEQEWVAWDEVENAEIGSQFDSLSDFSLSKLLVEMLELYSYLLAFCRTGAHAISMNICWNVDICCENVECMEPGMKFVVKFQSYLHFKRKRTWPRNVISAQVWHEEGTRKQTKEGQRNAINVWKFHAAQCGRESSVIWSKTFLWFNFCVFHICFIHVSWMLKCSKAIHCTLCYIRLHVMCKNSKKRVIWVSPCNLQTFLHHLTELCRVFLMYIVTNFNIKFHFICHSSAHFFNSTYNV